jgi:hypothetical protein
VQDKDLDAECYIQQNLATLLDALYILAQTVLVQHYDQDFDDGGGFDSGGDNSFWQPCR